ncbi:MAG TPA: HEAT repeat domain-containing protein, partial [Thermoanaerobaculia bacterium]|nr:HEAT repeat domain-containing protein [Thermoanaerobaculia bacterium]
GSIWETVTRELLAGRQLSPHQREQALAASASAVDLAQWIENLLRQSGTARGGGGIGTVRGGAGGAGGAGGGSGGGGAGSGARAGSGTGGGGGAGAGGAGLGGVGAVGDAEATAAGPADGAALVATLGEAISTRLGEVRGPARHTATREVLDLTSRLPPRLRQTLLQASLRPLAVDEDAAESLRAVAAAQPPAGVLSTLRQLHTDRQKLSASALRLARELTAAAHAAREAAAPADAAAVEAIRTLFANRDVDQVGQPAPVADDPRAVVALPRPRALEPGEVPDLGPRRDTLADDSLARQLTATLLELIATRPPMEPPEEPTLWRLEDLYRGFLLAGHIHQATGIVEALRDQLQQARDAGVSDAELRRCVERLANREAIAALLAALPQLPSPADARGLVDVLGPVAVRHLVAALPEETDRSRRHQLLDLLTSLGPAVVPHATLLLSDGRWFVVRNMVLLLRTVGDQASLPQVRRCAEHPDLRVRLEAIKSLFAADSQRSADLLAQAINDRDPKVAEAAIGLVGSYNIIQGVAPLVALLRRWDPLRLRKEVRVHAIRALGRLADPAALPWLEPWFRDRLSMRPREERLAAFEALGGYPEAARRPIVARGLRSRDPEVRALCARVGTAGAAERRGVDETHV